MLSIVSIPKHVQEPYEDVLLTEFIDKHRDSPDFYTEVLAPSYSGYANFAAKLATSSEKKNPAHSNISPKERLRFHSAPTSFYFVLVCSSSVPDSDSALL